MISVSKSPVERLMSNTLHWSGGWVGLRQRRRGRDTHLILIMDPQEQDKDIDNPLDHVPRYENITPPPGPREEEEEEGIEEVGRRMHYPVGIGHLPEELRM